MGGSAGDAPAPVRTAALSGGANVIQSGSAANLWAGLPQRAPGHPGGHCGRSHLLALMIRQTHPGSIPPTRGKKTWHRHGVRGQIRANFPAVPFRQRVLIESILSPTWRKVLASTAGHSSATQQVQVQVRCCCSTWPSTSTGHGVVEAHGYSEHIRRSGKENLDPTSSEQRFPARRWVVERTLAWLSKCRALLVRHDRHANNFHGLFRLSCTLLWFRRLHRLSVLR